MYLYILNGDFYETTEAIYLHERAFTSKELMSFLVEYINLKTTDEDRRIINNILYEGTPEHITYRKNVRLARRVRDYSDFHGFFKNKGFIKIENYAEFQCDRDNFYARGYDYSSQSSLGKVNKDGN